jgi:hypothetical protein
MRLEHIDAKQETFVIWGYICKGGSCSTNHPSMIGLSAPGETALTSFL